MLWLCPLPVTPSRSWVQVCEVVICASTLESPDELLAAAREGTAEAVAVLQAGGCCCCCCYATPCAGTTLLDYTSYNNSLATLAPFSYTSRQPLTSFHKQPSESLRAQQCCSTTPQPLVNLCARQSAVSLLHCLKLQQWPSSLTGACSCLPTEVSVPCAVSLRCGTSNPIVKVCHFAFLFPIT